MRLTKETENALNCLAYLAAQPEGAIVQAADMAEAIGVSGPFTSKILQRLAHAGIVRGHRGNPRGYSLARPPEKISARSAVEAIEGDSVFQRCLFGIDECSDEHACSLHAVWKKIRPQVRSMLGELSVLDLARKRKAG
jgi:Rrf2 family protein